MKKYFIVFLAFFLTCISVIAQQNKSLQNQKVNNSAFQSRKAVTPADSIPKQKNLIVIGKNYGDSVVIRWAPAKATLWYFANKSGYTIVRYEVENKKLLRESKKTLSPDPIKPWTLNEWKKRALPSDSLAASSAELLYGQSKVTTNKSKTNGVNLQGALNSNYELENKHGMALFLADQSAFLATGLGLRYTDKDIVKGKTYVYIIYARTDPKIVRSDSNAVMINTSEIMPSPEMPKITVEELDRTVKFKWNRQIASANFTGYFYERSEDKGKTYKRRNRQPYTQFTSENKPAGNSTIELNDSLPVNYKPYYYRIIGITAFGDYGKPTAPLPVMGRDRTPPSPPGMISAVNLRNTRVKISWTKKLHEPDFMGYLIGRGENATGPYMPLVLNPLPVSATEFIDSTAALHGSNYYVVSAIDTAGNAGTSIPAYVVMVDSIPPAKPIGLAGLVDTSGIVHLHWRRGKEPDLMGYLVYSANSADHIFTPVTKDFLIDSTFADSITLATLTKHIYYKVVAFDKNRNPSSYSDVLELKRPDKVPPVTPVFNNFRLTDSTVVLSWVLSSSDDVASQILYRREKGKDWVPYAKLTVKINSYIDTDVKKHAWYEYSIEAIDDAGLHSQKSFPVNVRIYDSGKRPPVQNFNVVKSPDGKSLQLSWQYSEKGDFWFIIYRSVNGIDMMTYKNLKADQHTFTDNNLTKGSYQYSVKAVYKDGGESQIVNSVPVNFVPVEK